ncbi:non-muscle caldesmon isoform X4 [Gadus morhua]|uniref:non-muscle caldesmon isoform X4 n=1 Tax=Gadus morhua TaxID=8049 RepID=UPI0011B7A762|nr:non-muscle caldesmon-like isoform X4 [Gadus morhua]
MDDDFDRRMELRRQRREQMRVEGDGVGGGNGEDDEEASRERRRRAREERKKTKDPEETGAEAGEVIDTNSVTETTTMETTLSNETTADHSTSNEAADADTTPDDDAADPSPDTAAADNAPAATEGGDTDDQVLLDRLAQREERRKKRMQEALERQKEFDPTITANGMDEEAPKEEAASGPEVVAEEQKPKRLGFKDKLEPTKQTGAFPGLNHHKPEPTPSRDSALSPEEAERLEAEKKLEELKRRRDNAENEELEKMKHKAQQSGAELEGLKKKREERKKVLEEEDRKRKQDLADKKAKEQEERKRMREEIEKRRADAVEKKKQLDESADAKPVFQVSTKGSAKIGAKADFLTKSAQKSSVRPSPVTPIFSKIGNRLEQYSSAMQGNKETPVKPPKSPMVDIPSGGARSIKNMWEKGNVTNPIDPPKKDTAGVKVGVPGRLNSLTAKPAEAAKAAPAAQPEPEPAPAPAKTPEATPGPIGNKRGQWEAKKVTTPGKVTFGGKGKFVTNASAGMRP